MENKAKRLTIGKLAALIIGALLTLSGIAMIIYPLAVMTLLGIALLILGIPTALCGIFPVKRVLPAALGVLLILIIAAAFMLRNRIRSISSIEKISDGFYTMKCFGDYGIDDYMNAGITSNSELFEWIGDRLFFGLTNDEIENEKFGCSAFSANMPDGSRIMGRNFDYSETDCVLVYTEPNGGYASFGMVDLQFFGVSGEGGLPSDSLWGKILMLASPYLCMDGMNEAGVGVGILEIDVDEVHQDNGNPDIMMCSAVRAILDKCASVDEAIDLLKKYDVHTDIGVSYHLFIADKSGKSVVVEWHGNDMLVSNDDVCTNFVQSEGELFQRGAGIDRYNKLKKRLAEEDSTLDVETAMELLSEVSQQKWNFATEWSCVYDLEDFNVTVSVDRNYKENFSFNRDGWSRG